MPNAYSYIRMSNETQLQGDSLRRQVELSSTYAREHGLNLVNDFALQDLGISAFKSVNAEAGALGRFLEAIEAGDIRKGSYLLVESLDRLSRDKLSSAMQLFLKITQSGVNIVTLMDGEVYRAGSIDLQQLMYSMVIMSRAHEESETKSRRVGAAWDNKRSNAQTKKLTRLCPAWLRLNDDRATFSIVAGRDDVVRDLFEKSAAGHGSNSLTRDLNSRRVPTFGSALTWHESYVSKILQNRSVIGEFQPHQVVGGKRVPVGDAVLDYYPRLIDDDLFFRVQASRRARITGAAGRKGATVSNLFTHIAKCDYCGSPMHIINKGRTPKGGQYLRCSLSGRGGACAATGWKYQNFETSFLLFAQEVDLSGVLNAAASKAARSALDERKQAVEERIRDMQYKRDKTFDLHISHKDTSYLVGKLQEYELQLGLAGEDLADIVAQIESTGPASAPDPGEIKDQIMKLRAYAGAEAYDHRLRLANRLRSVVTSLTLAPDGGRPRMEKTLTMLATEEPDEEFRETLGSYLVAKARKANAFHPTFQVTFADGTVRRIVVDRDDPEKLLVETVIDASGDAMVLTVDRDPWYLPRPLSDADIDQMLADSEAAS